MPRLPRIHIDTAVYYVTAKGAQHQEIFRDKGDYQMYLELLTKYKSQHKFRLYSYCLLPDRLSLLIETGDDATISQIMHDLNSLYTKYYNGKYSRRGHLFEARFRSVLVEKAKFLLKASRYIHRLSGADVKNYPYSSFQVFTEGKGSVEMAGEAQEILAALSSLGTASYERYCLEGDAKEIEELEKSLKRGSVLGSEEFVNDVKNRIQQHVEEKETAKQAVYTKPNRLVVALVGSFVVMASASSVYLYISKSALETKYTALVEKKEAEFKEKIKFENRNPLTLTDLDGTEWEIDMVPVTGSSGAPIRDKIIFKKGKVLSIYLMAQGFAPTNYSLNVQGGGMQSWETIQSNPKGDSASWRGDWQGGAMKGVLSFRTGGEVPRDFSFFSNKWTYVQAEMLK